MKSTFTSGHHSKKSEHYEMSQVNDEDPFVSRTLQADSSSFYREGNNPVSSQSTSLYEQSTNDKKKGVLSLSKAFENKLNQADRQPTQPDTKTTASFNVRQQPRLITTNDVIQTNERQPIQFHVPQSHAYEMSAYVMAPSGRGEQCQVIDLDDSNYSIRFVPRESGTHSVSVKHNGIEIAGSPFEFFVGPVAGKGSRSIQVYGSGLNGGYVNEKCQFEIYTKEAGAGSLSVAIEGPVKSEIDFADRKDGTCVVSYHCTETGEYKISVKFDEQHVPGSPFLAFIKSQYTTDHGMRLIDNQYGTHHMNEQLSFTVDMTGRKGRLEAYIVSPNGIQKPCTLLEGQNNSYTIRFTPDQSGIHWVHVKYNGREIPDSPFRVPVNDSICDPSKVFASGSGLYQGCVDSRCEFIVDTSMAGSGALSVTVDGPSRVDIDCIETDNGYRASYIPTSPGTYVVIIKFADIQIAGSPFHCHVVGSSSMHSKAELLRPIDIHVSEQEVPNAERVSAYGSGLSRAFAFEDSHFTVDTRNAGRSVLTISIQGPRKPVRDIEVRKCGDNMYDVCYQLPQSGVYHLTVKWADRHIMGSPFTLNVT